MSLENIENNQKELFKLFRDHDKIISSQNEQIRELMLVIMGDTKLNIEGIIMSQKKDNEMRQLIFKKMDHIQERIKNLESYTSTIDTFIKIAGNSKFWKFVGWIVLIVAMSYATLTDKVKDLLHFFK
ncbi:MAG: hypothetical protein WD512_20205 [Candidatus Paceibacterota bacterium]